MELSKMERLNLSFQLKILEKLYPEEASYYAEHRKAIEEGYSLHYDWLLETIHDEMSIEECKEVLDILDMYRAITYSLEKIEDKSNLNETYLKFSGFDGNHESEQLAYTRYFIYDLDRYKELTYGNDLPDLNSHCPMLGKYRKMLVEWKKCENQLNLSKESINQIINA